MTRLEPIPKTRILERGAPIAERPSGVAGLVFTQEQAAQLIVAHRTGDRRALGLLAQLCRPWLRRLGYRYLHRGLEIEDAIQIGYLGLIRAAEDYDPERGRWIDYLTGWVRSYLDLHSMRATVVRSPRRGRAIRSASLDAPLAEGENGTHLDLLEAPEPSALSAHSPDELAALLEPLSELQRLCVERRLQGYSVAEIGQEFGFTSQNASNTIRLALRRLGRGVEGE